MILTVINKMLFVWHVKAMIYVIHDNYHDYHEALMVIIGIKFLIIAQH